VNYLANRWHGSFVINYYPQHRARPLTPIAAKVTISDYYCTLRLNLIFVDEFRDTLNHCPPTTYGLGAFGYVVVFMRGVHFMPNNFCIPNTLHGVLLDAALKQ
jgi:hypothetical protein